jgi:cytochrome c553
MKLIATGVLVLVSGLAVGVFGASAQAANLQEGQAVWEQLNCASCHGADAVNGIDPSYPTLAGQHADFLEHALISYQRGARGLPASANVRKNAIMSAFAMQLSKQDIQNVSAWLASLPSPLSTKK